MISEKAVPMLRFHKALPSLVVAMAWQSAPAQTVVGWSQLGGSFRKSPEMTGIVGQAYLTPFLASSSGGWQGGFLAHPLLVNNAPFVSGSLADLREPSHFKEIQVSLGGIFSDIDGDSLRYSATCAPSLSCAIRGQTLLLGGALGASGWDTVRVNAADAGGRSAAVRLAIFQNKISFQLGLDSLKTYGDASTIIVMNSTSGDPVSVQVADSSVANVNGARISVLGAGRTALVATAPNADTVVQYLTVAPKKLVIVADSTGKLVGAADPALNYVASGLVGRDMLTGALSRTPGEADGQYRITQGSLDAGSNYDLDFVDAPFTILRVSGLGPLSRRVASAELALHARRAFAHRDQAYMGGGRSSSNSCENEGCQEVELMIDGSVEVDLGIYDNIGTLVVSRGISIGEAELANMPRTSDGRRRVVMSWNLRTEAGQVVAPGVYLWWVKVVTGDGKKREAIARIGVK